MKPNKPDRLRERNPSVIDVLRKAVEFLEWGEWIREEYAKTKRDTSAVRLV